MQPNDPPTMPDIVAHFINSLGLTDKSPLDWRIEDGTAYSATMRYYGRIIWVRWTQREQRDSSGPRRKALIEFTTDGECRFDQLNCKILWSIVGEEANIGSDRGFAFSMLPHGGHAELEVLDGSTPLILASVLQNFGRTWEYFSLDKFIKQP